MVSQLLRCYATKQQQIMEVLWTIIVQCHTVSFHSTIDLLLGDPIVENTLAISTSRTANKNSRRIRALSWYLLIAYQSHNNMNDHLTWPWESPELNAWVSRYQCLDTNTKRKVYIYKKSQHQPNTKGPGWIYKAVS